MALLLVQEALLLLQFFELGALIGDLLGTPAAVFKHVDGDPRVVGVGQF